MQRIDDGPVRENWHQTVIDQGLVYVDTHYQDPHNPQLQHMVSYWREGQYYLLDESEVTKIGVAGAKLYQALIALGEKILGFERSAHDIMNEETGKLLLSLVQYARPIAERAGDIPAP